jgi:transcription elongation factor Elf1
MRHRHPFENKYCGKCQRTTRHDVKEATFSCSRCGAVKYLVCAVTVKPTPNGLALSA